MPNQINIFGGYAKLISDGFRETFGKLSPEQLNWKPNQSDWSIGQCVDHLITTNNLYVANIQKVVDGRHQNNLFSRIPFFADLVGRQLKKAVSPDSKRKIKTFPVFEPSMSDINEKIITDFGKNQDRLISLMKALRGFDVRKIKIVTPVSDAVSIRLIDAFEVLIMHERRHFNQAKRVMEAEGFPG